MTRRPRLFAPWVALATVCTALMWLYPGEETIPYHVAWIGVALAFGIEPWSVTRTYFAILGFSVISGAILVLRAATGYIGWGETAEIPLMSALLLVSMWHVRRRQSAMGELVELSRRERLQAEQRERLARVTSHVMRTPLTIAMGYVDLLLQRAADGQEQADLVVVREELGRLERASDRLVRMIKLQEPADLGGGRPGRVRARGGRAVGQRGGPALGRGRPRGHRHHRLGAVARVSSTP